MRLSEVKVSTPEHVAYARKLFKRVALALTPVVESKFKHFKTDYGEEELKAKWGYKTVKVSLERAPLQVSVSAFVDPVRIGKSEIDVLETNNMLLELKDKILHALRDFQPVSGLKTEKDGQYQWDHQTFHSHDDFLAYRTTLTVL